MIIVTTPLAFTRARIVSPTPVLTFWIVLVNREFPPAVTPGLIPCELSVGTDSPTVIDAGILSVAMILGASINRVLVVLSFAWRRARSSRLWPTRSPAVRLIPGALPVEVAGLLV